MDQKIKSALAAVKESFISLRTGLDHIVVGYPELKDSLVCALFRRALGLKGHLLVFSAPGLAKTTLIKGASRLISAMNGGHINYARVQGRSDLTPEDFISRRKSEYEQGKLHFVNALQIVKMFLSDTVTGLPGFWHFDEIDKVPARAQFGLLQVMEEQQVTVEGLGTKDLNFTLFATANTKKYDPQAQPLATSVKDRFTAVIELGFLPLDQDVEVLKLVGAGVRRTEPVIKPITPSDIVALRQFVAEQGLGSLVGISDQIFSGCATVTKLTQAKVNGFTDFSGKFKVSAGPRSYIDLLQESAVMSLLAGYDTVKPTTCIKVGCRTYRGRVEMSPEVTMNGDTADSIITKILYEVFGDVNGGGSGTENFQ